MNLLRLALTLPFLALTAAAAGADAPRVYAERGIAISGYDAVIYFTENAARKGSREFALMWRGATWHFVSADTMGVFEMNPRAYAPQYGGFCASAMAEGALSPPSPEVFAVIGGKLYLNASGSAGEYWLQHADAQISRANTHWSALTGK